MAEYFNAKKILPPELMAAVLEHIPEDSRSGALLYFSEDYYAKRNAEIERCFQIYQSDPSFGSNIAIYEELSEQYGLTTRQICKIVKGVRNTDDRKTPARRRYSGVRVGRSSRRMTVRTEAGQGR
jgi:hypothetical protein